MNIILVCASGMSTSLLVRKMITESKKRGLRDCNISACSIDELENHMDAFDVVLIGPQLRYRQQEVAELAEPRNKKYAVIDLLSYGTMNGQKALDQALEL